MPVPRLDANMSVLLPQHVLRPAKRNGLVPQCEHRRILAMKIFRQDRLHNWPHALDAVLDAHGLVKAHSLAHVALVQASRKQNGSAANKIEPIS